MFIRQWVYILAGTAACAVAQPDPAALGRKALDDLLAGRYQELSSTFNQTLSAVFTPDVLSGRMRQELEEFGKPGEIGTPAVAKDGQITLVSFPVTFSKTKVNIQFHIEDSGKLAAIHLRPAESPLPAMWSRAPYVKPDAFRERDVTIGSDPWKLGGTLTVPVGAGPFPAVVLVHGPGPNNRDEELRANKVFADLAEGLSSRGIAVLRYDKRTLVYGRQMSTTEFTLREETIDDAVTAAAFLRSQPEVDAARVYVLGHSLGGYAAPRIAEASAEANGKLAGLIFLAANARPIQDLVFEQTEYLASVGALPADEARKRLDALKVEVEKINALQPGADNPPVVMGLPSAWMLDVKEYDPVAAAAGLSLPMFFLQGGRDFQVSMKDFDHWKAALGSRTNASFHSYPALNHLFIAGKGKSLPAEYLNPSNVSAEVIGDIAEWIGASKK